MSLTPVFYDMETFWSQTYSLTKLTPIEYVMGEEYETQSVALKVGLDGPTEVIFGHEAIAERFARIDWSSAWAIAHNNEGFDALILAWRFGIKPKLWGCTLAMSRPLHALGVGGSLKALAAHYGLQAKGSLEAVNTKGKRLADFNLADVAAMREYNAIDVELCAELFKRLAKQTTVEELRLIDTTIRMIVEPKFEVDTELLVDTLRRERLRKGEMLDKLSLMLGCTHSHLSQNLRSAPRFSALLAGLGAAVPMKTSPKTGKEIPALAKTDEGMQELLDHDDPVVVMAAAVRLDTKSTILETRLQRFIDASRLCGGKMPIPLKYYGASTGRWAATFKLNLQNLPRVDPDRPKLSDALRKSLCAPRGYKVVVADLSGIELRVNHFLWKVQSSMDAFKADPKADLYRLYAAMRSGKDPEDVTKDERRLAKVCVAEGTLVLTDRGLVPIEQVNTSDRVWDGIEWVNHDGPIYNGEREVLTYDGITATPDHIVWVEDGRAVSLGYAASQSLGLARTGAGWTPMGFCGVDRNDVPEGQRLQAGSRSLYRVRDGEVGRLRQSSYWQDEGVPVVQPEVRGADVVAATDGGRPAAVHEPERCGVSVVWGKGGRVPVHERVGGGGVGDGEPRTPQEQRVGQGGLLRPLRAGESAVGDPQTERGESAHRAHDQPPPVPASAPGDTIRRQHASESAEQGVDVRGDYRAVQPPVGQTKRRVWDLLNCGPRHRFTANGRLISNCQLGLGYGSGWKTFQKVARTMGGLVLSDQAAKKSVWDWRDTYQPIVRGWEHCEKALHRVYNREIYPVDPWGLCTTDNGGIHIPKGVIRYPNLRRETVTSELSDTAQDKWYYGEGRNKTFIAGFKVDENLVQAISRRVMTDVILAFARTEFGHKYTLAHTVHDEVVYVVEDRDADDVLGLLLELMSTPPTWWPELITTAEGDIAQNYGDAK